MEENKKNIISDKAEIAKANNILNRENNDNAIQRGIDNKGISIEECPIVPIGSQILLEWNFTTVGKGGIMLPEPTMKFPYPKVIGIGGMVKTVSLGDRVYIKPTAVKQIEAYEEPITDFKFHLVYESSILGIYTGPVDLIEKNPDSKIII